MNNLEWWFNSLNLLDEDKYTILNHRSDINLYSLPEGYNRLSSEFLSMLPNSNISNSTHILKLDTCATNFIEYLFSKFVSDDTLIITTNVEHPKVLNIVNRYKNKVILTYQDIISYNFNIVKNNINKYKNVFVYIIGTQVSTGEITPQFYLVKLKELLNQYNCNYKFVLDDVHGMFMVPRDYSIFDYIIYTSHALFENYNMGILISNRNSELNIGYQYNTWLNCYLTMLRVLFKYRNHINYFNMIMSEYCQKYIKYNNSNLLKFTAPHIFSLEIHNMNFNKDICNRLKDHTISLEGINQDNIYLRLRATQVMCDKENVLEGLRLFDRYYRQLININI